MKTHYQPNRHKDYLQCGAVMKANTETTWHLDAITCRVCMFSYLAEQAPWAREFMDKLRGADVAVKRSAQATRGTQLEPVAIPAALSEPVDGIVKGGRVTLGRPFRQEGGSQKAISELLPESAAGLGPIQKIMDYSGAAAEPVGVQPGEITK